MRAALLRRPLLLWLLYAAVLTILGAAAKSLWPDLTSGAAGLSPLQIGVQAALTLLPLPFAAALGWRRAGFVPPRGWLVMLFPLATVAFGYLGPLRQQPAVSIALAVLLVLLVALGEETAFRGVLLPLLLPRGTAFAVAVSSALFGLTHLVNLVLGAPLPGVLLQVVFAGMGAAGFAALRLRTGSLWPGIALHAAYDLTFRVVVVQPGTAFANTIYTLHGLGWLLFAALVLRKRRSASGSASAGLRQRSHFSPVIAPMTPSTDRFQTAAHTPHLRSAASGEPE